MRTNAGDIMGTNELTVLVSALAIAISNNISDDNDLGLLAAIFTQLGDTLGTIAVQRDLLNKKVN